MPLSGQINPGNKEGDLPDRHRTTQQPRRLHARQQQIRRELHEQVSDEQDTRRQVEVGPCHPQVFFQRAKPSL